VVLGKDVGNSGRENDKYMKEKEDYMDKTREGFKVSRRFAGIEIPLELKGSHFFNLYVATLLIACLSAVPAILQPAFLKEVISIPKEQAGSINSGLQNMSQLATLFFVGLAGILSDRVGRRVLAAIGFLVCGISFVLFGYAKDISLAMGITSMGGQVFVTYITRFIVGIGLILAWPQFITMVADYTYQRDRGKAMAIHGAMMGLGSIIVFGVLTQVAKKMGLMSVFYMAGGLGFLGLIITRLGLVDRMPKDKAVKLGVKEIYSVVSKSLPLKVTYLATFITRVDIQFISVFFMVWMVYAGEQFGINAVKATARGGMVMMVMSIAALIAYPIGGVLLDRWGRVQVLVSALILAGTGFCLMAAIGNPFSSTMYIFVPLVAVGFSGATMAATTLAADSSPKPLLGSILGGLNTMQPFGLLIVQLGGFLLDKFGYWSPFLLKGVMDLSCAVWILVVMKNIPATKEKGP
jgi:MFS family permease